MLSNLWPAKHQWSRGRGELYTAFNNITLQQFNKWTMKYKNSIFPTLNDLGLIPTQILDLVPARPLHY